MKYKFRLLAFPSTVLKCLLHKKLRYTYNSLHTWKSSLWLALGSYYERNCTLQSLQQTPNRSAHANIGNCSIFVTFLLYRLIIAYCGVILERSNVRFSPPTSTSNKNAEVLTVVSVPKSSRPKEWILKRWVSRRYEFHFRARHLTQHRHARRARVIFCELKALGCNSYDKVNPTSLFSYDVQRQKNTIVLP